MSSSIGTSADGTQAEIAVGGVKKAVIGDSGVQPQLQSISASVASNAITVTLSPSALGFRSATLTSGAVTIVPNAASVSLSIAATDSFGAVTANGNRRIAILAINNAGTVELAASSLAGGVNLDETGVITTATTATTLTAIKAAAVRTGVAYRVVGFINVPFTTAVGWGALVTVQGTGGQALAAMSSLGYGQTWQAVTGSRSAGTTYYNTTGKPIFVSVECKGVVGSNPSVGVSIAGVVLPSSYVPAVAGYAPSVAISFIVPAGMSYVVTVSSGSITVFTELR